ncbi:SMI1/KNR4 family protein [Streptomyces sp. SID12501]|uniref:SMI1/KNR4 family protein n=1 Tax=Streptomyces sp. SID12501 TaxID=2706042 RepID=A0A6B3BLM8_9ACTN|nr:SMI1/KNR4 family protein [Streptomyces sp. SID12501]NEC84486.1 SMI1/KNR4 family protein [Streptomyces sp. SID12501]
MEDLTGIAALRQLLPPPPGAGEKIDWEAAEARWGTRFPRDYMDFMSVYGVGGIGSEEDFHEIGILAPFPTGAYEFSPDDFEDETGNASLAWEEEGPDQDDLDLDPEHILAWGYTNHADILCWMTSDPDPDKWPVLLFARHGSVTCEVVPCGMVEFLRRLFVNELPSYSLDFPPAPRFVHWRKERGLPPLAQ